MNRFASEILRQKQNKVDDLSLAKWFVDEMYGDKLEVNSVQRKEELLIISVVNEELIGSTIEVEL